MKLDLKELKRMLEGQAERLAVDVPPILFEVETSNFDTTGDDDDDKATY